VRSARWVTEGTESRDWTARISGSVRAGLCDLSVMIALADGAVYTLRDPPERAELAMHNAWRTGREALIDMSRVLSVRATTNGPGHGHRSRASVSSMGVSNRSVLPGGERDA
jgi:hypothetical protein